MLVGTLRESVVQVEHLLPEAEEAHAPLRVVLCLVVACVAHHHPCRPVSVERLRHTSEPKMRDGCAVRLREHYPIVGGSLDTQRDGQSLPADVA